MTSLSSDRLQLLPLTYSQLEVLSTSRAALEVSLGLCISDINLSADASFLTEFTHALANHMLPAVAEHPDHVAWFTHWLIINRELNLTIGGIGASGLPNSEGEVMIGYFMDKQFEGRGYMTEAVGPFVAWLMQTPGLKAVIADTPVWHVGSQRVLQKCGFTLNGEVEEGLRWRKLPH